MITSARTQIIEAMTSADIEAVAPQILSKASDAFLDAALEQRLRSIDAKRLINALARAERLGYEPSDVVDEEDDPAESQSPADQYEHAMHVAAPPPPVAMTQPAPPPPQASEAPQPVPGSGHEAPVPPDKILYCKMCFRKFVYRSAYEHHVGKEICTRSPVAPGGYKYSCQHCGQGFTTIMGVQYHNSHNVCGNYKDHWKPDPQPMGDHRGDLSQFAPTPTKTTPKTPASAPKVTLTHVSAPTSTPGSSQAVDQSSSSGGPRMGTPGFYNPNGSVSDPYAHLSPEQMAAMQQELRLAELSYGERFRLANAIPDETERKTKLDGLSNSFGTKQSLIRKKYGVRLRMRRTKAEIQAEKERMQYRTAAELAADNGIPTAPPGRPARSVASSPSRPPAVVARSSNGGTGSAWASVNRPGAPNGTPARQPPMSRPILETPVPLPMMGSFEGAGTKRRLSGPSPSSESKKRVAYSEMGGLSGGTTAQAETMDPTLPREGLSTVSAKGLGTAEEPVALDDSDSDSDDSDDDNEDIPAELPPSVRQSLQQTSRSATPGPQPGSGLQSGDAK
jgi:hypothetical protein